MDDDALLQQQEQNENDARCIFIYIFIISFYYFLLFYFYFPSSDGWDPSEKGAAAVRVWGGNLGEVTFNSAYSSPSFQSRLRLVPPYSTANQTRQLRPDSLSLLDEEVPPTHTHISCVSGPFFASAPMRFPPSLNLFSCLHGK
jgi:hypothetical protein